jgi:hypothetical protein
VFGLDVFRLIGQRYCRNRKTLSVLKKTLDLD